MTEEILKKLMEMGLSNMEGRVYIELLSKDSAGGYQIAKEIIFNIMLYGADKCIVIAIYLNPISKRSSL